jgi:hypothetical protein
MVEAKELKMEQRSWKLDWNNIGRDKAINSSWMP